ncbi:hypothetical protein AX17_004573 [Amanita inopinata Kibby_2008]|nr:hypothetical protein AX17_004573 [Amanita inopinata Kibby_2008]
MSHLLAYPDHEPAVYTRKMNDSPSEKADNGEAITADPTALDHRLQQSLERKILRQIDLRLLPMLALMYALAVIDRANIGVARIVGMDKDLQISIGSRYSIVTFIYFIPFIALQLPSNLLVRRIGASQFLSLCVISWGAVQLAMGFVPSWKYLAVCRFLLGVFEARFFPALVFLISTWYVRHEIQRRPNALSLATFYLLSILVGSFSPLLAYAFSLLGGKLGIAGWAWIFIIEGAVTVAFGLASWKCLPDFPDKNRFLSADQTAWVLRRIDEDRGDSTADAITLAKVMSHVADWKIWAFALMYLCATTPAYASGFFIPIILEGMGWTSKVSMLLSTPPFVIAGMSNMVFAWISDKTRHRALFIAISACITIIGQVLTGFTRQPGARYTGLCLSNIGAGGSISGILAYSSNNVVSHSKRAVMTATVISFAGLGGIFASTVFRQVDYPKYIPGIYATISWFKETHPWSWKGESGFCIHYE